MANILLTGAGGFLGSTLLPLLTKKDNIVYGMYRRLPASVPRNVVPVLGDITKDNLGLEYDLDIDTVVHCAAMMSFNDRDENKLIETNVGGTVGVLNWMHVHNVKRLFHISTAYQFHNNYYEISKERAEEIVALTSDITSTIFRPSIIIGDSKLQGLPPPNGLYLAIRAIDTAKQWIENKAKLPNLRATIRIEGNPDGYLNLIPVDWVAHTIASNIEQDTTGVVYVTNRFPPKLSFIQQVVSKALNVDVQIVLSFEPNPAERIVARMIKTLKPYLRGCELPAGEVSISLSPDFIEASIKKFLGR